MKKFFICMGLIFVIIVLSTAFVPEREGVCESTSYFRLHVRANSNSEADQSVKYLVKDEIVRFLAPLVAECDGKEEAMVAVSASLSQTEAAAERVLRQNGFGYEVRAEIRKEQFPTRVYENVTLEAGVYDALIVELGEGTGDNWWCVVYPPLCFTSAKNEFVYKSKIMEIIEKFFG